MWKLQTVWRYRGMTWPNISWTEKHSAWMRRGAHTPVGGERVLLLVRLIAIRPFTPNASCTSRTSYLSLHSSEVSDKALQTRGIELKIKNTHIQNRNVEWGKYFPAVKDESVMQKSKIRRWRGIQINKVRLAFNQLLPERWYLFLLIPVILSERSAVITDSEYTLTISSRSMTWGHLSTLSIRHLLKLLWVPLRQSPQPLLLLKWFALCLFQGLEPQTFPFHSSSCSNFPLMVNPETSGPTFKVCYWHFNWAKHCFLSPERKKKTKLYKYKFRKSILFK